MNILVFSWRDPKHPNAGGAEQVMHEHMKGWVDVGHNVTFLSSRIQGGSNKEILNGVKIMRRGSQYLGVQFEGLKYYLANRKNIDLVVDQFHGIPFFTPLYVKKPILAVLQEVAGKVWLKNDLPFPLNFIIGLVGYVTEPLVFWLYRRVIFMVGSNSAKTDLQKMSIPTENITIVPHGVILPKKKIIYKKETIPTILFFGAVSKDKGIKDALETFAILNKKGFKFWIAGRASDYYRNLIISIAKKKGFYRNLTPWFGYITDEKKFELMAKAHLLVNPSILEGWGLINIEANSVGTPVVAYNSPGLVDSVSQKQSGIICKVNSPQEMAKEIFSLVSHPNQYRQLQTGAEQWSKKFSWQKSKKMSLTLVRRLVH